MWKLRERFHKTWRSLCKTSGAASRKRLMQTCHTSYAAYRLVIACVQTRADLYSVFSSTSGESLYAVRPPTKSIVHSLPNNNPRFPPSTRPRHRPHFGPLSEACRTQTPFRSLFLGRRTLTPFRSRRWPEGYVVGSPFLANALLWGYLRNVRTQMRMPPMMFSILTL